MADGRWQMADDKYISRDLVAHNYIRAWALKDGRAGGGPGTAVRRLHGDHVRRSPSDPPTLARCEHSIRGRAIRALVPALRLTALPWGRSPRLLGARPVRWPLRDQVSACSSSASVHIVPCTQVWTAAASLTPMCRLLLPGFSSTRRAKSATFGSAELSVAYRRHPSPHASPTCPPFPPRVGGTPRVCALVCCAIPKTASVPSNYRSAILILAVVVFAMQGKWAQVTLPQLLDRAIFVIVGLLEACACVVATVCKLVLCRNKWSCQLFLLRFRCHCLMLIEAETVQDALVRPRTCAHRGVGP